MNISLIANSGIQFHKFNLTLDLNAEVSRPIGFYEFLDEKTGSLSLEYAYYLPDDDIYVAKRILQQFGYLGPNNEIKPEVNPNLLIPLREDEEYFTVSDIESCLEIYENTWLPLPFFKKNKLQSYTFGPVAWARIMLKDITPEDFPKAQKQYKVILSFDTKTDPDAPFAFTPRQEDTGPGENHFGLSNDEDHNLNFLSDKFGCGWVYDYLLEMAHEGQLKLQFPSLRFLGQYLYLIKYLDKLNVLPQVDFYTDQGETIDVDLVLDIGNSNTCGILFESPTGKGKSFTFNSVKKLKIQDISNPALDYNDPFSMRLVFAKAKLGDIFIPQFPKSFEWPSLVRVGNEASRLINRYQFDSKKGTETATQNSSPKRYLWDDDPTTIPWEFITIRPDDDVVDEFEEKDPQPQPITMAERAYYEGISEQFREDGVYAAGSQSGAIPYYSRKSLMTFVYIEIFLHALSQINSYEFRDEHERPERARKIRRVTITCPSAIVQEEQVILRSCAVDAAKALSNFYAGNLYGSDDLPIFFDIIPSPKDLGRKINAFENKKDWIYDEATCSQLVFLYAEISKRYLNRADTFFELFGKRRADVIEPDRNSITIGTVDIGGGTTDLMICAYQYEPNMSNALIKPNPLFWESFNLAGDDLLKEIVQQIVLEGPITSDYEKDCKGVIANYAESVGCLNVAEKMINFFGPDSNRQGYRQRIFRKNFNVQISIPIAMRYLEHASQDKEDEYVDFDQLFGKIPPNKDLIEFFNHHFGGDFDFKAIKWKLSKKRVFDIVTNTFDKLIMRLSILMSAAGCDFVLLAGKPTTLPRIRELFIKHFPVTPDRIITLNNYRVGGWYPFADDKGFFKDPKTIVSVGAIIALMGGRIDELDGFRLDTKLLRKKMISTADYVGAYDRTTSDVDFTYLSPTQNKNEITVSSLPLVMGYKQLSNHSYPGRPMYVLDFNEEKIREKVIERNNFSSDEEVAVKEEVKRYVNTLKSRMPFKILIRRDISESKEQLKIERVKDADRNESSRTFLKLSLMTLQDKTGYWLDTGEFILNIN